jgi:hypothetical protein
MMGKSRSNAAISTSVFSIDWLSLTVHAGYFEVMKYVTLLGLHEGLVHSGHGGTGFRDLYNGKNGFQLYANPVGSGNYCSLSIPSQALQGVGMEALLSMYSALCEDALRTGLRYNVTRADYAFDVPETAFTPVDVWRIIEKREGIETKVSEEHMTRMHNKAKTGDTVYVGSPKSDKRVRVYRKVIEGSSVFGDAPFTRVEMQNRHEAALFSFMHLMTVPMEDWAGVAAQYLNGFFTLRVKWWADFMEGVKSAYVRLRLVLPSIGRIEAWLFKQVTPALACWLAARSAGEVDAMSSAVRALLNDGANRWDERYKHMIASFEPDVKERLAVFSL